MKYTKWLVIPFLAVALVLAGCGDNTHEASGNDTASTEQTQEQPAGLILTIVWDNNVSVTFWADTYEVADNRYSIACGEECLSIPTTGPTSPKAIISKSGMESEKASNLKPLKDVVLPTSTTPRL